MTKSIEIRPASVISRFGGVSLLLFLLPSCATRAVWRLDDSGQGYVERRVPSEVQADHLRVDADRHRLLLVDANRQLAAEHGLQASSGEARGLLLRPDLFVVAEAVLSGEVMSGDDCALAAPVELRLTGELRDHVWRSEVPIGELSAAAQRELLTPVGATCAGLPTVLRDCGERLLAVDAERLIDGEVGARVTSLVFVRPTGVPARRLGSSLPVDMGFEDRARVLRKFDLFAHVQVDGGARIVKVDPVAFWLVAQIKRVEGQWEHRSSAQLAPVGVAGGAPLGEVPLRCELGAIVREPVSVSPWLRAAQVVLTPPAVIIDAVIVAPFTVGVFVVYMFSDGC